jgi:hypothetical protein
MIDSNFHIPTPRSAASGILLAGLVSLAAAKASAQTYTVVDLSPTAGNAVANGISGGVAGGGTARGIFDTFTRATLWTGAGDIELHPVGFDDTASGVAGRSVVLDVSGTFQVGWASGVTTGNRPVPVVWSGTADSVRTLAIPFVNFGGQATGTDGSQVVGFATGLDRDGVVQGPTHAMVWDAGTGAAVDLGDGGGGAIAYGVAGGQQVGYVVKGQARAALWSGSARSLVVLHPKNAVVSVANGTDGQRQVGYAGYDVRVRVEAAKGNKDARFNYATVWTGSAASAVSIHPYPVNALAGVTLAHSFALGTQGSWVVGYAGDASKTGTPAYSHAIVWDGSFEAIDLNAFLPAGFVGAQALAVDAAGNVSGFMAKADGTRHAVVWLLDPAP